MAKSRGWSTPPSLFTGLVEEALTQRVRVIALAMLNEIVLRSPVDTGRFRGNNIVSVGAPVYTSSTNVDPTGSETIQQGVRVMTGLEPFTQVFIQNNLPYAVPLEDGHSQQAPAGIYAVSFNSVSQAYS
ncbi:HK97 gp10 family phage protein [Pseudomonas aeruginosa]|uniref:HK97 gp10 family phage protein n=1 Tax=Pseudomonas aeruginosa TaxID=287 RepID=UPI00295339F1|nr:HK97 gp10 family phage protein [Pseudomonas aeruginosa]MDV7845900.1 HK97 gp10 family phage protein [Pseudomonas aeruginosa]HEP9015960.1 HK97 gp10 family phage protein [Pseudomonas aeruginosa]